MTQVNDITFDAQDEYNRKPIAEKIISLLDAEIDISPLVLDGTFGTGKTEFCHKLVNLMRNQNNHHVIYIDAFEADHADHPDIAEARKGEAKPIGGHEDPARHNSGDNESEFTSWTTDKGQAEDYASGLMEGELKPGGVILTDKVNKSDLIKSPDKYNESEVLRKGPIKGADVEEIE